MKTLSDPISITSVASLIPPKIPIAEIIGDGDPDLRELLSIYGYRSIAVAGNRPAPDMAGKACSDALERAGISGRDVTLLCYCSNWLQGPEGWPPTALIHGSVVSPNAMAVEIKQGCNGMLAAIQVARWHLHDNPEGCVVVVGSDNFGTPLVDRLRLGDGYVVGDGAVACVLTRGDGELTIRGSGWTSFPAAEVLARGDQPLFPPSTALGRPLDFGANARAGQRRLREDKVDFVRSSRKLVGAVVDEVSHQAGRTPTHLAFMNYAEDIVLARANDCGIPRTNTNSEIGASIGHCGCADQFIYLADLVEQTASTRPKQVLMLGMAPGLHVIAISVEVST